MPDSIRLAIDIWMPDFQEIPEPLPAILSSTRYWRSEEEPLNDDYGNSRVVQEARAFTNKGYIYIVADMRGTGASFGVRKGEWSLQERDDLGHIVDWISHQDWCNGNVGSFGISYAGNSTFQTAATCQNSLKVIAPQFADYDTYSHIAFPGGVPNKWLLNNWGRYTKALDNNEVKSLTGDGGEKIDCENDVNNQSVRLVDGDDGTLLAKAVSEHKENLNLLEIIDSIVYSDDGSLLSGGNDTTIHSCCDIIAESAVPIHYWAGWQDAATSEGAINLFCNFSNPMRIRIGPWSHGMSYWHDPFDINPPEPITIEDNINGVIESIGSYLKIDKTKSSTNEHVLEYYTMGENQWKSTTCWPIPGTMIKRLYFAENKRLSDKLPTATKGSDQCQVNPEITTGTDNRWHTQMGRNPVIFTDRRYVKEGVLTYTSPELDNDMEITGRVKVSLFVSSTAADGFFMTYLEMVAPDGRVTLITEGYLRALHRKVSEKSDIKGVDVYHSYKRADAITLIPGKTEELLISLLPTSIVIPKSYRLRLSVSFADKDTFETEESSRGATIELMFNSIAASCIEIPIIPISKSNLGQN